MFWKLAISIIFLFGILYTFIERSNNVYLILPKNKINTHFYIVGSVSRANSYNDILHRPILNNHPNQYYFKENNNKISVIRPSTFVKYGEDFDSDNFGISDSWSMNFPIIFNTPQNYIIDITSWYKTNFEFNNKHIGNLYNHVIHVKNNNFNIEIEYSHKSIQYSFVFLPDDSNYKPRYAHQNVGYFTTSIKTLNIYGTDIDHYINRWDCKDPINIYIDYSVPTKYISIFKEGIEEWNNAFKLFKSNCEINGISIYDSEWNNDYINGNAKYTTISLAPSIMDDTYAIGHSNIDIRNGRIFHGNVMVSGKWINYWSYQFDKLNILIDINNKSRCLGNIQNNNKYYKRIFIERGMKSIVIHEIGHILGLRHNFKSSSLVDFNNLFNKERIEKEGIITSIMDYINVIINPSIMYMCDIKDIMNNVYIMDKIGIYDKWAIKYGYQINENKSYENANSINQLLDYAGDELHSTDPFVYTGDISNDPIQVYIDNIKIDLYIINNYLNTNKEYNNKYGLNFNTKWKTLDKLIQNFYIKLLGTIRHSLLFIGGIHININDDTAYNVPKIYQLKVLQFIKDIMHSNKYLPDISINKYLGTFDNCDVGQFDICQGKYFINLEEIKYNINMMVNMVLKNKNIIERIDNTQKVFPKSLSVEEYFEFMINI